MSKLNSCSGHSSNSLNFILYCVFSRPVITWSQVLDPQHKEDLHSYLQLVDDEQDESDNVDEEEEDDSDGSDEDSDDASVEDVEVESDDMECEIDEEFRKEIKLALGDAALPSSEVCHLYYNILCEDT